MRPYSTYQQTKAHQNTISSEIEIKYPFHPLYGERLKTKHKSITRKGTILVKAPKGFCKEIPCWMTHPQSANHHISKIPHISLKAILRTIELVENSIVDLIL